MSKLAFIVPAIFGVMAVGATVSLDYYKKQLLAEDGNYSASMYIKDAASSFKAQAREVAANRSLVDYLGEAPEGWTKRDFSAADMELLTGKPPATPTESVPEMSKQSEALMAIVGGVATRGAQKAGITFEDDGTLIVVQASFLPARIMTGFGGKQVGMMADMMNMQNMGDDFAIVRGLKFEEPWDRRDDLDYRRFSASLGQQIQISVLTNATSDDDVMAILATLDVASMNQMLVDPIPEMGENDILLLASADDARASQTDAKPSVLDEAVKQVAEKEGEGDARIAEDALAATDEAEPEHSFADRLSALLGSGAKADAEPEKPKRMVCVVQQGFKRCAFPKQD